MSSTDIEMTEMKLQVSTETMEAFKSCVWEKYGRTGRIAGFEFEREIRAFVNNGEDARTRALVDDLAGAVGVDDREKNFSREPDRTDRADVRYRIPESLRSEFMSIASKGNFRSAGALLGALLWRYATEGSIHERNNEALERVASAVTRNSDDSRSKPEKKRDALVDALDLDDGEPFTMADFGDANAASAYDLGEKYAQKKYLPKVLDALGYTWSPAEMGVFVPGEVVDVPEAQRDPRTKPYRLMDDGDKRRAIKAAAYKAVSETSRRYLKFTVEDAVDAAHGRPQRTTAKKIMRAIADTPGFTFDAGESTLKLNQSTIDAAEENDDFQAMVDIDAVTGDEETAANATETRRLGDPCEGWLPEAAAEIPDAAVGKDAVVRNQIARAQHPEEVEDGEVSDAAFDAVTVNEMQRVRNEVDGDQDATSGEDASSAGDKADRRLDTLSEAVATNVD